MGEKCGIIQKFKKFGILKIYIIKIIQNIFKNGLKSIYNSINKISLRISNFFKNSKKIIKIINILKINFIYLLS